MSAIDLSEFDSVAPGRLKCWASQLSDEQLAKVTAARAAGHSYPTISKVVTGWGVKVSSSAVANHANGDCLCPKK